MNEWISIQNANEHNLNQLSVKIPKRKLTVITGVSGSGKSTLTFDVLYQESHRQFIEAMGLQGIEKAKVDSIQGLSPALAVTQQQIASANPRSTIGTKTDMYTSLRMIYEKLGIGPCPNCKQTVDPLQAQEITEQSEGEFTVYQVCPHCHEAYKKLTRSYFSYNTVEGACPECKGIGKVIQINRTALINEELSIENGAIALWEGRYLNYQIDNIKRAMNYYDVPLADNQPLKDYSDLQLKLLYDGTSSQDIQTLSRKPAPQRIEDGKFEGVLTSLWRKYQEKNGNMGKDQLYFHSSTCPSCQGTKLHDKSREIKVLDQSISEISTLDLELLLEWVNKCRQQLSPEAIELIEVYLRDIEIKLKRIKRLGLGYLTLERRTDSLSGGENQRLRLSSVLDSDLTDVLYIIDEPSSSLHAKNTHGIIQILKQLRDKGNTVVVIEHNTDIMKEADYLIEIGPYAGRFGGKLIGAGTLDDLKQNEHSLIKNYLSDHPQPKEKFRKGSATPITIKEANVHNLQSINVSIPTEVLISVTGVSGSGKSSLVFDVLAEQNTNVTGLDPFQEIISINQATITKMKRSNVATYTNVFTFIRELFASLKESKNQGLTSKHFSFNTSGGRCDHCEGLGYVLSNRLFFEDIEVVCPRCKGKRFKEKILNINYHHYNINDCLECSIEEAANIFKKEAKIHRILKLLQEIGLGYLKLGQSLTTLSGGEGQRLKLSTSLIKKTKQKTLFLLDEPSAGLHPYDIQFLLDLFKRLVDKGNTIIMVEHHPRMINASDWVIDLGPEGGLKGGKIIAEGTPRDIQRNKNSVTGPYL
ncbi:ATP-binding cassette domain-containing protein [Facklamia lactis]|uniref:ATP-binding cassette domain-containing protein n=1 Tax=Facklamia lactis TaxID=2749967 RepID=UPI0018CFE820|nr:excinuclease ABC subunit UvrA [Facklamia lactis]MBG9979450.1 excinuclease ABC subunit UvrA [Facklamia lactis]